jgi:hypothetical protein
MPIEPKTIPVRDVAEYLAEITRGLATMAREAGLYAVASALRTAHCAVEDVLSRCHVANADPEEAA